MNLKNKLGIFHQDGFSIRSVATVVKLASATRRATLWENQLHHSATAKFV